jgi:hypothetical protein
MITDEEFLQITESITTMSIGNDTCSDQEAGALKE